jgi:GDSL-like Lipase/Acylhydrolase family
MTNTGAEGGAVGIRRWAPVLLVLCSIMVGILLSEACYRMARRFVCLGVPDARVWAQVPGYGWGHKPNGEGVLFACLGRRFEWRTYIKINSLGLRDREHTYEKPTGTRRVLLLGDSITEGMQVPLDRTFARLVESDLHGRSLPIEVINAGVSAFSTDNELLFFRAEGIRYAPDVVVLVFNAMNDVSETSRALITRVYSRTPEKLLPKTYFHVGPAGELVAEPAPPPSPPPTPSPVSWSQWIEARLFVARGLRRLIARVTAPAKPVPVGSAPTATAPVGPAPTMDLTIYDVAKIPPDAMWTQAWQLTEALIRALRKDVERSGARFAVVVVPCREAVSPAAWQIQQRFFPALAAIPHDPSYPVARITAFLEREGIPYLNLLPPLRSAAERTGTTGFFSWDVHLDATGNAVVAKSLAPFVADLVKRLP